jgi:hypothetical protein
MIQKALLLLNEPEKLQAMVMISLINSWRTIAYHEI